MEGHLKDFLISSRLDKKHDCPGWFLFLIGWHFQKSSPLKLGSTMNCYFVGMMCGRSWTNFHILCQSYDENGHHRQFLFVYLQTSKQHVPEYVFQIFCKFISMANQIIWITYNRYKGVSDCCLSPTQQFFIYVMTRTN